LASRSELGLALEHARARTEALLEPLVDEQLTRQFSQLQSPLVWDLAHVGHFEELWLLRNGDAASHGDLYDAFAHARAERVELPILSPGDARAYVRDVRERVLERLPDIDPDLVAMVVQHELQHAETIAQTLALGGLLDAHPLPPVEATGEVVVPGGAFTMGSNDAWAYDNERPPHAVDVPRFRIDRALVTNAEYAAFVESGGYRDRGLWSDDGWAWREAEGAEAPLYWDSERPPPREPVLHVSFHEAEAYARFAGKRLPIEAEWEKAVKSAGAELEHATGAAWQWTSSALEGYPGFRAYPYREYSEPFFGGEHRVLRGGSWITDPLVARPTFRNWDFPQRRQIFSGIRCAGDG